MLSAIDVKRGVIKRAFLDPRNLMASVPTASLMDSSVFFDANLTSLPKREQQWTRAAGYRPMIERRSEPQSMRSSAMYERNESVRRHVILLCDA